MGVSTGPSLIDERKIPDAMPFSREGNQLLMVEVTPIGSGPSATPNSIRQIFNCTIEPTMPVKAVAIEVKIIAMLNTFRTPKREINQAEGSCTSA
ncbi:Uncharacterised protein [Cedecea neteri]|uniref:Uncharacterized protein n=1 Tax=Cedecea neteri TaxID=158822 RepID=A0A2X3IK53_9ENTR|nr:Uncharacterised protein [Cedecea neteri]